MAATAATAFAFVVPAPQPRTAGSAPSSELRLSRLWKGTVDVRKKREEVHSVLALRSCPKVRRGWRKDPLGAWVLCLQAQAAIVHSFVSLDTLVAGWVEQARCIEVSERCSRLFASKLHAFRVKTGRNHSLTSRIGGVPALAALGAAAGVFQQH